jgi:ERCC4-type nuclease
MEPNMNGEPPTIIVDTREQKPLEFVTSIVKGLSTGDYSILGYEDEFTIEHKTIKDLIGTCDYRNRERFRRELGRMQDGYKFYCIVISGNESDIDATCKKLYTTQYKQWIAKTKRGIKCRKPMRPEVRIPSVKGSLKAFRADFNCHYYFLGDKERCAEFIQECAEYYTRHKDDGD